MDSRKEKNNLVKNLTILIVSYNLFKFALTPTDQLQSSLYIVKGLGTTSDSFGDAVSIVSCLLLPPIVAQIIGHKNCVLLGFVAQAVKTAANFYPTPAILIISKIIYNALYNVSNASRFTLLSVLTSRYATVTGASLDKVLSIVYAINGFMGYASAIVGDIIVYVVLDAGYQSGNYSVTEDDSFRNKCGNAFLASEHENVGNFRTPPIAFVYILFGVFFAVIVCSFLCCLLFLDKTTDTFTGNSNAVSVRDRFWLLFETLALNRDWRAICLFLYNINIGLIGVFRTSDINKAFVTCLLGMQYIGLGSLVTSGVSGFYTLLCTYFMRYSRRTPIVMFSILCQLVLLLIAILWTPKLSNDYLTVGFLTGIYGLIPSGVNIVFHVLHAVMFPQKQEASFANYLLAQNLGGMIGNAYSETLAMSYEVYLLLCVMVVGTVCYLLIEWSLKTSSFDEKTDKENSSDTTVAIYRKVSNYTE